MTHIHLRSGRPYPLGATWDGEGVNFAVFSRHATRVELCLFSDPTAQKEAVVIPMPARTDAIWHVYVAGLGVGQLYGFRVHGPYAPSEGHRFNANKVLLDPYARAIGRPLTWADAMFGYEIGHADGDLSFDDRDNARFAPLSAVVDPRFKWGSDRPPRVPWEKTIIYEAHVRGLTMQHAGIAANQRGTYAAISSRKMITHLRQLGVTTVELLPVQYHLDERRLVEGGLTNYWGYSPLAYFAPNPRYAVGSQPQSVILEFKRMVKRLHAAGIEVLLDVVYNHTGEGNQWGPTICYRGIDNSSYYRLERRDRRLYTDFSGCGNCLEIHHPVVVRLIADSLRYWVQEMHVDGFRFDLAPVLGRDHHHFNPLGTFFQVAHQDPVLSRVKLIAEPWDLGDGGYQLGHFPAPWREWNGKYRDSVRDFWRGERSAKGEFAARICGSHDLFGHNHRNAMASINLVTCHDGFPLHDLVSYNEKHNEANGEENRDGEEHNRSWNCGVEGPTTDTAITELRARQRRNFLTTLLLSHGVPMLRAGDEIGLTQGGNNNSYCQDNELSWHNWNLQQPERGLLAFVQRLGQLQTQIGRAEPVHPLRLGPDVATDGGELDSAGRPADGGIGLARRVAADRGPLLIATRELNAGRPFGRPTDVSGVQCTQ